MTKYGKVLRVLPNSNALFQLLITSKRNTISLKFRLDPVLNSKVPSKKSIDGIYSFDSDMEVFVWIFTSYKRHVHRDCVKFLLDNYPSVFEAGLGVHVLPSKRVSLKKFNDYFNKKYSGFFMEVMPNEVPEESSVNKNFYEVVSSLNGRVLADYEVFLIPKAEYNKWKRRHGKDVPFVMTKQNHLKVS
jgi:hypothetical protein